MTRKINLSWDKAFSRQEICFLLRSSLGASISIWHVFNLLSPSVSIPPHFTTRYPIIIVGRGATTIPYTQFKLHYGRFARINAISDINYNDWFCVVLDRHRLHGQIEKDAQNLAMSMGSVSVTKPLGTRVISEQAKTCGVLNHFLNSVCDGIYGICCWAGRT